MAIRVVQWATGSIGKTCLRQVIEHPDLELVGLYVHSDKKAGRDAGDIARRPPTGVIATQSVDEIVALDADVVLHMPLNGPGLLDEHDADIKRLLRSGKNVITLVAHTYPYAFGKDYAGEFEAAARAGKATLFGGGINPGFMTERIAVTLTGICTSVNSVTVTEVYDVSDVQSYGFLFDLMGIGRPPAAFQDMSGNRGVFEHMFQEVVAFAGHALKIDFDEIVPDHDFAVATSPVTLPAGTVKPGGVVNFRWRWHGMAHGRAVFTAEMLWISDRSLPGWDLDDGWDIEIRGAPNVKVRIDLSDPENMPDRSKAIQYGVAGPIIRAIPEVVKAPPGILLPPIFAAYSTSM